MRDLIREAIDRAERPGDRGGVDEWTDPLTRLAADTIRLARLATSIHLVESARHVVDGGFAGDDDRRRRELTP